MVARAIYTCLWMVKILLFTNKIKKIVVTGCLAERYRDELANEIPEADIILGIGSNSKLCEAIKESFEKDETICSYGEKEALALEGDRVLTTLPFYAYLKIAEGCDNKCTYCAIPLIRGKLRSRTIEDIVKEAKELEELGLDRVKVDENGYVCDENDRICLASSDLEWGTVVSTPFGKEGCVYDCGCDSGTLDVYVDF